MEDGGLGVACCSLLARGAAGLGAADGAAVFPGVAGEAGVVLETVVVVAAGPAAWELEVGAETEEEDGTEDRGSAWEQWMLK